MLVAYWGPIVRSRSALESDYVQPIGWPFVQLVVVSVCNGQLSVPDKRGPCDSFHCCRQDLLELERRVLIY